MTSKEFIERLKDNDYIYKTDENGNVVMTKTAGEIFEYHFKRLEKDLERLEKQDKILNALLKNANYHYDEWYGMRGNQCIMIGITEKDECFEEVREMVENYG